VSATVSALGAFALGSSLSLASFVRLCGSLSSMGRAPIGENLSTLTESVMGSCRSNRAYDRLGNGLRVAMGLPWQVAVYPSEAPGISTVVLLVLFCPRRVGFGTLILPCEFRSSW
jgi:hypothetical protein